MDDVPPDRYPLFLQVFVFNCTAKWLRCHKAQQIMSSRSSSAGPRRFAGQAFHVRYQIQPFLIAELDRDYQARTACPVDATVLAVPHRIGERRNRCVMHVGRARGDRPQRRGLEGEVQTYVFDLTATTLIRRGGADVMEAVVGEPPAAVARGTGGLADE
jgi:hypothetical protein